VKVAAYQAPLLPSGSMVAIDLIRARIAWCEAEGVEILCCPEGILGGLADYATPPFDFALNVTNGQLANVLAPLASDTVTTLVGFSEVTASGQLFNSAAIFEKGAVTGVYRKFHPAIRKSVYQAGDETPVFTIGSLTFGILICYDSQFPELASEMAAKGATAIFVLSNNGLPIEKADIVQDARDLDTGIAVSNGVTVIRADVAGRTGNLVAYGSSGIVEPDGRVVQSAERLAEGLLVADLTVTASSRSPL
jgi:predicted amidohydrolase